MCLWAHSHPHESTLIEVRRQHKENGRRKKTQAKQEGKREREEKQNRLRNDMEDKNRRRKRKNCVQDWQTRTLRLFSAGENSAVDFTAAFSSAILSSTFDKERREHSDIRQQGARFSCPKVLCIRSANEKIVRHIVPSVEEGRKKM